MKKNGILLFFIIVLAWSCKKDVDDNKNVPLDIEIKDFVWKGMNTYYLWQSQVSLLSDRRFGASLEQTTPSNNTEYYHFLKSFHSPAELFENLKYNDDRFSFIVENYEELERSIQGVSLSMGFNFGLYRVNNYSPDVLGVVRYVIPNSFAERNGIERGDIFFLVDGEQLTLHNYQSLLDNDKTSVSLGFLSSASGTSTITITIPKTEISENPVHIVKTFSVGNHKIGYLMYNQFINSYDFDLNNAFAQFKNEGITDLVLDLRYNTGGHVTSAIHLASMITGQFNNRLFTKERWNSKLHSEMERLGRTDNYFTNVIRNDASTTPINSLYMNKVYIITSDRTASASELIINGLKPYIDVVQIGDVTLGKNQGSITVYDWIDNQNKNPKHKWAMQPIVLKMENANGFSEYAQGLDPDIHIIEDSQNMGVLGELSDPLLYRAVRLITGTGRYHDDDNTASAVKPFATSKSFQFGANEMILDKYLINK